MENLHAPTVPSGPTSNPAGTNGIQTAGLTFTQLQTKKDNIEAELRALGSVLESHRVDMNTSLITSDGFPRADIDVAQIRTTRSRIIYLKNDYKALMAVIEKHIHEHFARQAELGIAEELANGTTGTDDRASSVSHPQQILGPPFAKVNSVVDGSPAHSAGLKAGDQVRNFGYVNITNHDGLKRVGECVQGNEGVSLFPPPIMEPELMASKRNILVQISRSSGGAETQELQLTLMPRRNWGGRGMLGCHILPL
ncbi:uncharacterized protein BP5553_06131 [Venustampulla echinocandica]|uniref:Nas2 N-terminal domain-containing protein n=1 Tax=Venustampulla echinocandica TaxID=2656787 RepID=A0A370TMN6_9HELO|nr:uncharacterized protein BP5553_06131 [Venustampulla echinocandica]RDL36779.1 hypothetical protein BP5553_06131 [Venustampulla echinocandica]